MTDQLLLVLKIAVSIATIGSLLELGLQLEFRKALVGLRNMRFVLLTLLWGFVLGPALAWLITRVLPLEQPYGIGLIVMSMVPCASYISLLVQRAGGDLCYSASFLLLTCFGMVVFIPFVLPALVTGVSVTSWDIGKPLVMLVLVPLLAGIAFRQVSRSVALKLCPLIKNTSVIALVICLITTVLLYAKGIVLSVGSLALLAHILFYVFLTAGTIACAYRMPNGQKSVLGIGMCSRNSGPAFATALSIPQVDGKTLVMCGLAILVQMTFSFLLGGWFGKQAGKARAEGATT
jgi:BASS family bile acid:Na+ symporter